MSLKSVQLAHFADTIRSIDFASIRCADDIPSSLLLAQQGTLSSYYIPFDTVNLAARVVIVGITPGFSQWRSATAEAQRQLLQGASETAAALAAKKTGAFSGAMRPNLVALLNEIGLQRWLGIADCASLFAADAGLVQMTSILRHPVFVKGTNYNGAPNMVRTPFLQQQMMDWFAQEAAQLNHPLYIPLGGKVADGLLWLARQGVLPESHVLSGLPHPSGASMERILYFLGKKERAVLSNKTNADKLDAAKSGLLAQMATLIAQQK